MLLYWTFDPRCQGGASGNGRAHEFLALSVDQSCGIFVIWWPCLESDGNAGRWGLWQEMDPRVNHMPLKDEFCPLPLPFCLSASGCHKVRIFFSTVSCCPIEPHLRPIAMDSVNPRLRPPNLPWAIDLNGFPQIHCHNNQTNQNPKFWLTQFPVAAWR